MQGTKKKNNIGIIALLLVGLAVVLFVVIYIVIKNTDANKPEEADRPDVSHTTESSAEKAGYYFEFSGIEIGIDDPAAPIIEALGEPVHYFEAPSCAYEGMDKIYTYAGFEFQTYTVGDEDYIISISFLDDTVATREGITICSTFEDVKDAYGENYENSFNQYSYVHGDCRLSFIIDNNEVISIEYAKE